MFLSTGGASCSTSVWRESRTPRHGHSGRRRSRPRCRPTQLAHRRRQSPSAPRRTCRPEQLRGEALDARTDLFSLGLVLYEMATGKRAFSGATSAVTSAAILHEQPTAPRELQADIPARFEQAILTLLEKDREVRTQTASELRAELTRLKRELTGLARMHDTARLCRGREPQTAHWSVR